VLYRAGKSIHLKHGAISSYSAVMNAGACENYAQWLGQGWLDGLKGK